jgi:hypothetical protein
LTATAEESEAPDERSAAPATARPDHRHRVLLPVLTVLGTAFLLAGIIVLWANRSVYQESVLARHTRQALQDPSVQTVLANNIVKAVEAHAGPRLLLIQPVIQAAATRLVSSPRFINAVTSTVTRIHHLLFESKLSERLINLSMRATLLLDRVRTISPRLAKQIPPHLTITLTKVKHLGQVIDFAKRVRTIAAVLGIVLVVLAIICFGAALWLRHELGASGKWIGVGIFAAGFLLLIILQLGQALVIGKVSDPTVSAAATASVRIFTDSLHTAGVLLACIGLVIFAASIVLPMTDLGERAKHLVSSGVGAITTEPASTTGRVVRALAFLAVGVLILIYRQTVFPLILAALGLGLLLVGGMAVFSLLTGHQVDASGAATAVRQRAGLIITGVVTLVLVGFLVAALLS